MAVRALSRLPLMAERQDVHGIGGRAVAIERNVAGITKANNQLAPARHINDRTANLRAGLQQCELPFDDLTCASRGLAVSGKQKQAASGQAEPRLFGDD